MDNCSRVDDDFACGELAGVNSEIILVDKPAGMSSFGVVARVRRELSEKAGYVEVRGKDGVMRRKRKKVKVGHTGTLDPFATGLLILLVGKGTKRAGEFLKLDKEYVAKLRLGAVSTTGDIEGKIFPFSTRGTLSSSKESDPRPPEESSSIVSKENFFPSKPLVVDVAGRVDLVSSGVDLTDGLKSEVVSLEAGLMDERFRGKIPERIVQKNPNKEAVEKCVGNFVGENWQTVPAFSAVKIDGKRAYKLAREGKQVEMPRRKVQIYEIEVLEYEWPWLVIRCKVSSGTYIRALGEDIGKALGTGAYVAELRRTQVGKYRVEEAESL